MARTIPYRCSVRTLVPAFFRETDLVLVRQRIDGRHYKLGPFEGSSYDGPSQVLGPHVHEALFLCKGSSYPWGLQ